MSATTRQKTCAVCGAAFRPDQATSLEPLIDDVIRYVAVCWGHTTFVHHTLERTPWQANQSSPSSAMSATIPS